MMERFVKKNHAVSARSARRLSLNPMHRRLSDTPEEMERKAGKLLFSAYNLRAKRANGLEDIHEMRHIFAALQIGNTDDCDPRNCKLDRHG
jgi:hypothetical protein